jgi:hypothetical protein
MLKQSYSRVKKILAILLTVLFVVSVTATACNALNPQPLPPVVKEEKTAIIFLKDVKTTTYKKTKDINSISKIELWDNTQPIPAEIRLWDNTQPLPWIARCNPVSGICYIGGGSGHVPT